MTAVMLYFSCPLSTTMEWFSPVLNLGVGLELCCASQVSIAFFEFDTTAGMISASRLQLDWGF